MNNTFQWSRFRKFLNDVHLWLGLTSGIFVLLICLSGTIYVYNTEIREFSQSKLYHINAEKNKNRIAAEKLIDLVEKETGGKVTSIKIPFDSDKSYILNVKKLKESKDSDTKKENSASLREKKGEKLGGKPDLGRSASSERGVQYMVNPYSGEILGNSNEKTALVELMQIMFSLHRWLLLDRIEEPIIGELPNRKLGSYISGTVTILFTLGVITGIFIWFPQKIKNWKNGLKIKWTANWKRLNYDLHNSLGFYSCLLLLIMGITGPQWSFPWYREALRKALGIYQPESFQKAEAPHSVISPNGNSKSILIDDLLSTANHHLKYSGDINITLPADSLDAVLVAKSEIGFFASSASDKLYLDQYSASILKTEIFDSKPWNERITASIKALHVGDFYGGFSKILYFIACLIATSLPVTGVLIFINKMKKS